MYALLLAPGFEEVEAVTPADFLRRAGVEVRLVGVGGRLVAGNHGIVLQADTTLEEMAAAEEPEGVILPGGMPGAANLAASPEVLSLIRRLHAQGRLVAAICAAPAVVLEPAGVLAGRRATCFPGFEDRLATARFSAGRVVVDGNVVTSRAAGTAAEFAEKLVELIAGRAKALEVHRRTLLRD
jgi:4-methyl-5(b-hydroxyethyl)-thiazole monophosphate biosynthesis